MAKFKRSKLLILSTLLIIVGCDNSSNDMSSVLNSEQLSSVSESTTSDTSVVESEHISTSEPIITEVTSISSETTVVSSSETPSSSEFGSSELSSSEVSIPESSSEPEIERDPGIYLERERVGVAVSKTITIEHEVYPSSLGSVTWEFIEYIEYFDSYYYADLTAEGEITANRFTSKELLIKGTLDDFEVYVSLMIFSDYDKQVDTFYPSYIMDDAIGRGNRYFNGTTMYAGISVLRNTHYYAYDLKAGMTFNVMAFTLYSYDRPKFYYEFGKVVNNRFVMLTGPFISDDGKVLLLGYDILEDGEYMVRVVPQVGLICHSYLDRLDHQADSHTS